MQNLTDAPPHRRTVADSLGTAARWPAGLMLVSWRYLWRVTALHRRDEEGTSDDLPPDLPADVVDDSIQQVSDGVGPLLHRRFRVRIMGSSMSPEELAAAVRGNVNKAVPSEVAFFRKLRGGSSPFHRGDEYVVRMPGPWDGPVRVVNQDSRSFRLATLRGHLEAGQIEFRADKVDGLLEFEIEAWARAGDRRSSFLYNRLRISKEIQLNMWVHVCLRVAAISGGRPVDGVEIVTRTLADLPAR